MSTNVTNQATDQAISEKEAMEIVSKIQGPEGIFAAADNFNKQIEIAKTQKAAIEAKLVGFKMVVDILNRLAVHWGIQKLDIASPMEATAPAPSGDHVDKETTERIANGMCLNKDKKTKKWCNRKLKTKREKDTGYCTTCQVRLGISARRGRKPAGE